MVANFLVPVFRKVHKCTLESLRVENEVRKETIRQAFIFFPFLSLTFGAPGAFLYFDLLLLGLFGAMVTKSEEFVLWWQGVYFGPRGNLCRR